MNSSNEIILFDSSNEIISLDSSNKIIKLNLLNIEAAFFLDISLNRLISLQQKVFIIKHPKAILFCCKKRTSRTTFITRLHQLIFQWKRRKKLGIMSNVGYTNICMSVSYYSVPLFRLRWSKKSLTWNALSVFCFAVKMLLGLINHVAFVWWSPRIIINVRNYSLINSIKYCKTINGF